MNAAFPEKITSSRGAYCVAATALTVVRSTRRGVCSIIVAFTRAPFARTYRPLTWGLRCRPRQQSVSH